MTVSQSGQLPPSPIERAYTTWQSPQRRSPTEEAVAAPRTLVDGVRHQQPLALEFSAQDGRIDGAVQRSPAQTIRQLLACRFARDGAGARWRATARRAGARDVDRARRR